MRSRSVWMALLTLVCMMPVAAGRAAESATAAAEMDPRVLETLLAPEADPALRQQALAEVVGRAQAADGWAAYLLGALYRSGKEHPAKLVERDPDTSRYWLLRCVDSEGCPLLALASLAELELAEGQAKPAMQWAQAWIVLDRELTARLPQEDRQSPTSLRALMRTSYHAYLIERCYALMHGNEQERNTQGLAWFNELRAKKGKALDKILFAAIDQRSDTIGPIDHGLEPTAENQRRRTLDGRVPTPRQPALGIYLFRGDPAGGQAESVQTIEALPNPAKTFGMKAMVRSMRTKPYEAPAAARRYAIVPLSFNQSNYYLFEPD